jgi:hypothetical protein
MSKIPHWKVLRIRQIWDPDLTFGIISDPAPEPIKKQKNDKPVILSV